jgi:hypothetical protein
MAGRPKGQEGKGDQGEQRAQVAAWPIGTCSWCHHGRIAPISNRSYLAVALFFRTEGRRRCTLSKTPGFRSNLPKGAGRTSSFSIPFRKQG